MNRRPGFPYKHPMYCPRCAHQNLPGADHCLRCLFDLASVDCPAPQDRIEASLMNDSVMVLGPKAPVTIAADAPVADAMARMMDRGVGAVLVTGPNRRLIGILTERDILDRGAGMVDLDRRPITELMTHHPVTSDPTESLARAVRKMSDGGYRHLPIVADGVPVGVISVRDLLRHVTRLCNRE